MDAAAVLPAPMARMTVAAPVTASPPANTPGREVWPVASSAMIHLGQSPSPETGKTDKSLPLAKQTIDILALLEEKTRGNLTAEESKLLSTVLYDLRMRFVQESR